MRPRSIVLLAGSLGLFLRAEVASAQGCPDGDWFCEPAPPPSAPERPEEPEAESEPEPRPHQRRKVTRWKGYFLPEEPAYPPPQSRRRVERRKWGFDLHVLSSLIAGQDAHPDAGLVGIGFGLRYRPLRHFALDGSLELAFGDDYNGDERTESALLANALGFLNPRDRLQIYLLAGLGLGSAEVTRRSASNVPLERGDENYTYFGMQAGVGVEARLTARVALRFDVLGFVRGRTDDDRRSDPEFIDPDTNRVTNTSGGALFRGGALFYF